MPAEPSTSGLLEVRTYRDGDEGAILDLFARCFPHAPRAVEHFIWKYRDSPYGKAHISLAYFDGSLAGHYAGYPVPFRAFGKDLLAHQIGDTMTDVGVRHIGRGPTSVLGRTALHFYENFCEGAIAFNYGFNVANIQKFSLRFLRSDRVEPVTYRVAPVPAPITRHERWLRGYSLQVVKETNAEWDALFDRVSGAYRFCVKRNAAYVRWRYLKHPEEPYHVVAVRKWRRLVGWIVFRIRDNRFTWGDALFDPHFPDAVEVALRHIVPSHRVDEVEAWFPPRPAWFDTILGELGFESRPEPQDLSLMCVPFTWSDVVARMREELYYAWGDSDLF